MPSAFRVTVPLAGVPSVLMLSAWPVFGSRSLASRSSFVVTPGRTTKWSSTAIGAALSTVTVMIAESVSPCESRIE